MRLPFVQRHGCARGCRDGAVGNHGEHGRRWSSWLGRLVAVASPAGPASAAACDLHLGRRRGRSTWTGRPDNWGGAGQPGDGDVVCIQDRRATSPSTAAASTWSPTQLTQRRRDRGQDRARRSSPAVPTWLGVGARHQRRAVHRQLRGGTGTTRVQGTVYLARRLLARLGAGRRRPAPGQPRDDDRRGARRGGLAGSLASPRATSERRARRQPGPRTRAPGWSPTAGPRTTIQAGGIARR